MPRRHALVTQADVARVIRAAKQEGAARVDVLTDGTISIALDGNQRDHLPAPPTPRLDEEKESVL